MELGIASNTGIHEVMQHWLLKADERLARLSQTTRFYSENEVPSLQDAVQVIADNRKMLSPAHEEDGRAGFTLSLAAYQAELGSVLKENETFLANYGFKLPEQKIIHQPPAENIQQNATRNSKVPQPIEQDVQGRHPPCTNNDSGGTSPSPRGDPRIPFLTLISEEEFQSTPKYMRGRMKCEQVNTFMERFNQALQDKYQLVLSKFKTLSKTDKDKVIKYREQIVPLTERRFFVVEADLRSVLTTREAPFLRQMIPILRHLQKISEVRTKGLVRYLVSQ